MLKAAGALLLLSGSFGFAFCICRERRRRLLFLKEILKLYKLLQSEISYTALPLPDIFAAAAEKTDSPLRDALLSVSRNMDFEMGKIFRDVWEKEMAAVLQGQPLTARQKVLFLSFPDCLGSRDSGGQAKAMEGYIKELENEISLQENEDKSKNKVIISLGIAAGLFMVIILL